MRAAVFGGEKSGKSTLIKGTSTSNQIKFELPNTEVLITMTEFPHDPLYFTAGQVEKHLVLYFVFNENNPKSLELVENLHRTVNLAKLNEKTITKVVAL